MNISNVNQVIQQDVSWNALDVSTPHPLSLKENPNVTVTLHQASNIQILTTNDEAIKGFETALKAAFTFAADLLFSEAVAREDLLDDLLQFLDFEQSRKLHICIENSKNIIIDARDYKLAATIQLAVQIFAAFLVLLGV